MNLTLLGKRLTAKPFGGSVWNVDTATFSQVYRQCDNWQLQHPQRWL